MNRERLLNLRQLLIEHHDNGLIFDLKYWGAIKHKNFTSNLMEDFEFEEIDENLCKTACCACGLHVIKRPEDGMRLVYVDNGGDVVDDVNYLNIVKDGEKYRNANIDLEYKGQYGTSASAAFYEISYQEASELFISYNYHYIDDRGYVDIYYDVNPLMVVEKIDYLLNGGNLEDNGCPYSYNYVWYQKRLIKEE